MATKHVVTEGAARELEAIAAYISCDLGSPAAAALLLREFQATARLVASFPESRALCADPHLAARGYRSFRFKGYLAVYSYAEGIVRILHVFHHSQDYAELVGHDDTDDAPL